MGERFYIRVGKDQDLLFAPMRATSAQGRTDLHSMYSLPVRMGRSVLGSTYEKRTNDSPSLVPDQP